MSLLCGQTGWQAFGHCGPNDSHYYSTTAMLLVLVLSGVLRQLYWPYSPWPNVFIAVPQWLWSPTVLSFSMQLQFNMPNLCNLTNYLFWPPASSNHPLFPTCLSFSLPPSLLSCLCSHPQPSSPRIIPKLDGATQTVVMVSTTKQHSMTSEAEPA